MGAACALAFGVFFALNDDAALRRTAREGDAMAWLRAEFRLDEAQFAAIKKLHDEFGEACGEHCAAIMDARERKASAAEVARLEKVCVDAMDAHFRRVAALMPAGQGERYLATVLPRVVTPPVASPSTRMETPSFSVGSSLRRFSLMTRLSATSLGQICTWCGSTRRSSRRATSPPETTTSQSFRR